MLFFLYIVFIMALVGASLYCVGTLFLISVGVIDKPPTDPRYPNEKWWKMSLNDINKAKKRAKEREAFEAYLDAEELRIYGPRSENGKD